MPFDAEHFTAPVRILDRDPKSLTTPRERLEYLRDFLRELPPGRFDMDEEGYGLREHENPLADCGTAVCIGGWCRVIFKTGDWQRFGLFGAGPVLGLTDGQMNALFYPFDMELNGGGRAIFLRDPKRAANVLDHLIRTGEVDWSVA